jgi:hypothetical protein
VSKETTMLHLQLLAKLSFFLKKKNVPVHVCFSIGLINLKLYWASKLKRNLEAISQKLDRIKENSTPTQKISVFILDYINDANFLW